MDTKERNKIFETHSNLIDRCIKKYFNDSNDKEDLYQIGAISLLKCIESYDSSKSNTFENYAFSCIRYGIYNYNNRMKLKMNQNHNAVNAIYSSIRNNEDFEKAFEEYNKKDRLPELDKVTFEFLYNNIKENNIDVDELSKREQRGESIVGTEDILDSYVEKETYESIYETAQEVVKRGRTSEKNQKIFMEYIYEVMNEDDIWGIQTKLSEKYGLTRERIRQIIKKIITEFSNRISEKDII